MAEGREYTVERVGKCGRCGKQAQLVGTVSIWDRVTQKQGRTLLCAACFAVEPEPTGSYKRRLIPGFPETYAKLRDWGGIRHRYNARDCLQWMQGIADSLYGVGVVTVEVHKTGTGSYSARIATSKGRQIMGTAEDLSDPGMAMIALAYKLGFQAGRLKKG